MATGPLGVNMVHAASLVGEAINTELAIATIRLQQTVEQDVEDRAEDHDAVTHVLVKVKKTYKPAMHIIYVP